MLTSNVHASITAYSSFDLKMIVECSQVLPLILSIILKAPYLQILLSSLYFLEGKKLDLLPLLAFYLCVFHSFCHTVAN